MRLLFLAALAGAILLAGCNTRRFNMTPEDNATACADLTDNDGDGAVDCADPECAPFCAIVVCGDGFCDAGEDAINCTLDCFCGDGVCDFTEDTVTCPADCTGGPACGDGICEFPEDATSCAADCGGGPTCGDGICEFPEDAITCSGDCGGGPTCGDGLCEFPEDSVSCALDCGGGGGFTCVDYCALQMGCGYIGGVWPTLTDCETDCLGLNTQPCLDCFETYMGGGQQCDADCDPAGCNTLCGTSMYCGG